MENKDEIIINENLKKPKVKKPLTEEQILPVHLLMQKLADQST
jgi:hypothetical protein